MAIDSAFLKKLRLAGIIEGSSTLVLFGIAMPLKYFADMPLAVTIVGSIHGVLFLWLMYMFIIGKGIVPLPLKLVVAGIVGAVVPFGPFVVDVWLGKLDKGAE